MNTDTAAGSHLQGEGDMPMGRIFRPPSDTNSCSLPSDTNPCFLCWPELRCLRGRGRTRAGPINTADLQPYRIHEKDLPL